MSTRHIFGLCIFITSINLFWCLEDKVTLTGNAVEKNIVVPPNGHLRRLGEHRRPEVEGITELDYIPNGRDFYANFARKRRPLIIRGAAKDWDAFKHWSNESYLREKYGDVLMDVEMGKSFDGSHLNVRKTMNMSEFLDKYKSQSMYLDSPFPQSNMINDLQVPYFMLCPELNKGLASAHLLFSSGNTSSSFHHDGYENLLTVISGKKVIHVFNYTYGKDVYANEIKSFPGLSPICPDQVDLVKYPKFADVPFHTVEIHPGDILYIPVHWWHHVRSYDSPNIAVSIWFYVFKGKDDSMPGYTEVLGQEDFIARVIANSPEYIQCESQNTPANVALNNSINGNNQTDDRHGIPSTNLITGFSVPMVGLSIFAEIPDFPEQTEKIVDDALLNGYRLVDTAPFYNESGVAAAIFNSNISRNELFIVSKVLPKNFGFSKTVASVAQSLSNLEVNYIDLTLLHTKACDPESFGNFGCEESETDRETWRDAWRALEYLVEIGKIRGIGVSNFEVSDLEELREFSKKPIAVVQNWFDPFNTDDKVREWCNANRVAYIGHSTLGELWQSVYGINPVLNDEMVQKIARELDIDPASVIINWALGKNVIVVTKSKNVKDLRGNLLANHIRLTEEEMKYLDSLAGTVELNKVADLKSSVDNPLSENENTAAVHQGEDNQRKNVKFVNKSICEKPVDMSRATIFISSDDHWIYAFDAESGQMMWKTLTGDETGSSCSFSLDGHIVYCGADDTYLRALHATNGTLAWKFKANGALTSSSHVGKDGTVFIGSHDFALYAFLPTGELRWKVTLESAIWASPVTSTKSGLVYIADKNKMVGIDVKTGAIKWKYKVSGPIVASPRLSPDESLLAIGDNVGILHCLNPANGAKLWRRKLEDMIISTPMISEHHNIYVSTDAGFFHAIDGKDGSDIWVTRLSKETSSSPILGKGDMIYIGAGNGTVHAFRRSDGHALWATDIGTGIYVSSPRLSKTGFLFIGTVDGPVVALNSTTGEVIWKAETEGPVVGTALVTREHLDWYT